MVTRNVGHGRKRVECRARAQAHRATEEFLETREQETTGNTVHGPPFIISVLPGEAEPYAVGDLMYAVCEESAFENTLAAWTTQQELSRSADALVAMSPAAPVALSAQHIDASAERRLTSSPYSNPISVVEAKDRAEDSAREGLLHFDGPHMAAGHFPTTPALPVAIVLANMVQCVSFLYDIPFEVRSLEMKCRRCAVLGEMVRFRASQVKPGVVQGTVMSAASGEELVSLKMQLSF